MPAAPRQGSAPKKRKALVGSANSKKTAGRTTNSSRGKQQSKHNGMKRKPEAKDSPNSRGKKTTQTQGLPAKRATSATSKTAL